VNAFQPKVCQAFFCKLKAVSSAAAINKSVEIGKQSCWEIVVGIIYRSLAFDLFA